MATNFQCTMVTPEQQVLDEKLTYASIPAWDGQIGIAPQRAPLLAKLGHGPMRLDTIDGKSHWFYVGGGFAQMKDNRLTLVTDEAVRAEDVDRAKAEIALRETQSVVPITDDELAAKELKQQRARVMLELGKH